ncbi:MAG: hypothetical protein R3C11_08450 [Planctomycetaceae bacterium]
MESKLPPIYKLHTKVFASLRPGYLTLLTGYDIGMIDGGVLVEVPYQKIPADLRIPNSKFITIFDQSRQLIGVERMVEEDIDSQPVVEEVAKPTRAFDPLDKCYFCGLVYGKYIWDEFSHMMRKELRTASSRFNDLDEQHRSDEMTVYSFPTQITDEVCFKYDDYGTLQEVELLVKRFADTLEQRKIRYQIEIYDGDDNLLNTLRYAPTDKEVQVREQRWKRRIIRFKILKYSLTFLYLVLLVYLLVLVFGPFFSN